MGRKTGRKPANEVLSPDEGEELRPIARLPGYFASSHGRIFGPHGMVPVRTRGRIAVTVAKKMTYHYIPVLVCEAFHGERPPGGCVGYLSGGNTDYRPDNLHWREGQSRVNMTEFVRAWQEAESVAQVAERVAITTTYAYIIARRLRSKGVPLKELTQSIDYAELADLAKKLID